MQLASSWASLWPPIGLCQLAALATRDGHSARVVDANVEDVPADRVAEIAAGFDVVVVSTSFPTLRSDAEMVRRLRLAHPAMRLVGLGVFFTLLREASLAELPGLDAALVGEPEQTFTELLARLAAGGDLGSVRGLLLPTLDGTRFTGERQLLDDLDTLPHPDLTLIRNDRYVLPHNGRPFTLVNTSRGCPYPCTFCVVQASYGRRVRRHSTGYILDEIAAGVRDQGLDHFLLWEEAFTLDRVAVREFCEGLAQRRLDVRWAATTRADSLDLDTLRAMKRAGCFLLGMGIESTSQEVLDQARKKAKVGDLARGVRLCREAGLPAMGHFVFGLPGETRATARATLRDMRRMGLTYMQSYCAVPYPGTEFGELAARLAQLRTVQESLDANHGHSSQQRHGAAKREGGGSRGDDFPYGG